MDRAEATTVEIPRWVALEIIERGINVTMEAWNLLFDACQSATGAQSVRCTSCGGFFVAEAGETRCASCEDFVERRNRRMAWCPACQKRGDLCPAHW